MVDFLHFLKNTSYPGRGILVGKDRVYYFIMGRSEMEQAEWKLLPRATELVCRAITEEEN